MKNDDAKIKAKNRILLIEHVFHFSHKKSDITSNVP